MNTPAWQALGFRPENMEAIAAKQARALDLWWAGPPASRDVAVETWAFTALTQGMERVALAFLGYRNLPSPLDDWREVGIRAVGAAIYYFFGPWRDGFTYFGEELDRNQARAKCPWISY